MIVGVAQLALVHQTQEGIHHIRGKLGAGNLLDDGDDLVKIHAVAVGTVGVHGVEAVRHRDDLGDAGDFVPFQMVGIAPAVRPLVVGLGPDGELRHDGDLLERFIALCRVGFDDLKFLVRELAGLVQHLRRHTDLADVVQKRDAVILFHGFVVIPQLL